MISINEVLEKVWDIIVPLRGIAIQSEYWKKNPGEKKKVNDKINQLEEDFTKLKTEWEKINSEISKRDNWIDPTKLKEEAKKKSMVSAEDYNKLLANQKPDNLPDDWEEQLTDKKQLKIKLDAAQTDLSNEKQARQQAEREKDQRPNVTLEEYAKLQNKNEQLQQQLDAKHVFPELSGGSKVMEKLNNLIKGVDDKTSQGELDRVETRVCLKVIRDGLEKIVIELQKEVDLKDSRKRESVINTEHQNLQIQPPKK